jgi:short-subunit dehydrogenase
MIGDIDEDLAHQTADRLTTETESHVRAARLDVTNAASIKAFFDTCEDRLGPLDIHINNAGIMPLSPLLDETDEATLRILQVNVWGVIATTREIGRRMTERGKGHIVNVASTAGKQGVAGGASYCASKSAVLVFDDAARQELRPLGVRLTTVLPGIVRTELAHGVKEVPGIPSVAPEDVATAIADEITNPRKEQVYVPKIAGPVLKYSSFVPRRVLDWASRRAGADQFLLDAARDPARAEYEARVKT